MKKSFIPFLLCGILTAGCENDNSPFASIIGKWKLVKTYSPMTGNFPAPIQDQRMEEYTRRKEKIRYDYAGTEMAKCNYRLADSKITLWGEPHESWRLDYAYWLNQDTLVIRIDGGFEYYDEFFIKVE